MNSYSCIVLVTLFCAINAQNQKPLPSKIQDSSARHKRDAVGNLEIITNNAHPIHAEVKPETLVPVDEINVDKPCPQYIPPSSIEMGTVFQVTPPKSAIYPNTSLRKSWPLTSRLDLIRSVTRVFTLVVLVFSAALEFYPLLQHLYDLYYN